MFFVDGKAIVPVGEPEKPVSTTVRARGRALVPGDKIKGRYICFRRELGRLNNNGKSGYLFNKFDYIFT